MTWKRKQISAFVSIWKGTAVKALRVEWLVNIANVMNEEAKRVRFCSVFAVREHSVLNGLVHITGKIIVAVISDAQPLNDHFDSIGQVVWVRRNISVVTGFALCYVGIIYKVEISLPRAAMVLYVICKSCALHVGVIVLTWGQT